MATHEAVDIRTVVDPAMALPTVLANAETERLALDRRDRALELLRAEELTELVLGIADRAARFIDQPSGVESGRASIVRHWTDTEGMVDARQ